jgi:phage-related protein
MARVRRQGGANDKRLVLFGGKIKTPPLSEGARRAVGRMLRALQRGEVLTMPHSRAMPAIGVRCHELRVNDENRTWRIFYRTDEDAVVVVHSTDKTTRATPGHVIELCRARFRQYDEMVGGAGG